MEWVKHRLVSILIKWILIAIIVFYLWYYGLFVVIFIWIPWMISYEVSLIIEYGLQPVLVYHGIWWLAAGLSIVGLIIFEFYTHYRHKRRDLRIGGEFEGRVVWTKGIREGLIYDLWDFKNCVSWLLKKKRGSASTTTNTFGNMVTSPGTWPDPWAIPIGDRTTSDYVIYFKRSYFQLFPSKLYISRDIDIETSFFNYWLPNMRFRTSPHPERPGLKIYRLEDVDSQSISVDPAKLTAENRKALKRSKVLVKNAILSDAETQKERRTKETLRIHQVKESEEAYD